MDIYYVCNTCIFLPMLIIFLSILAFPSLCCVVDHSLLMLFPGSVDTDVSTEDWVQGKGRLYLHTRPLGASGGIPGSGCISSIFPEGSYEVPAPTGGLNCWVPGKPPLPHGMALHSEVGGWGWGGFLLCYSLVCLTIACLASEPSQHLKWVPSVKFFPLNFLAWDVFLTGCWLTNTLHLSR